MYRKYIEHVQKSWSINKNVSSTVLESARECMEVLQSSSEFQMLRVIEVAIRCLRVLEREGEGTLWRGCKHHGKNENLAECAGEKELKNVYLGAIAFEKLEPEALHINLHTRSQPLRTPGGKGGDPLP